jgi:hypothetical protein
MGPLLIGLLVAVGLGAGALILAYGERFRRRSLARRRMDDRDLRVTARRMVVVALLAALAVGLIYLVDQMARAQAAGYPWGSLLLCLISLLLYALGVLIVYVSVLWGRNGLRLGAGGEE